jgi:hypothetical protein
MGYKYCPPIILLRFINSHPMESHVYINMSRTLLRIMKHGFPMGFPMGKPSKNKTPPAAKARG